MTLRKNPGVYKRVEMKLFIDPMKSHSNVLFLCILEVLLVFFCCHFLNLVDYLIAGSRPPLILQSPLPYAPSPREGGPDHKQLLQQRKKVPAVKEEKDMYDIVSSPNKDSTKLTLKLSRVKSNGSDPPGNSIVVSQFI